MTCEIPWNGQVLEANTIICAAANSEWSFHTPNGTNHWVIFIPTQKLAQYLGPEAYALHGETGQLLKCSRRQFLRMGALVKRILAGPQQTEPAAQALVPAQQFEARILAEVADLLGGSSWAGCFLNSGSVTKEIKMRYTGQLLAAILLTGLAGCASAPATPLPAGLTESGTVTIRQDDLLRAESGVAGEGTLIFQGWQHTFTFEGARIDVVNHENAVVNGAVFNLEHYEDFEGTFLPTKTEFEAGEGLTGVWGKNENDVLVHLTFRGEDVQVDLEAEVGAKVVFNE